MKIPRPRGTAIDADRVEEWLSDFSSYRHGVTENRIDRWLDQFANSNKDLAARILDCVDYIPHEQISAAFRSLLNGLPGWNKQESQRQGKWRFVPFTFTSGKSGDSMIHQFRVATGLAVDRYNEMFIHMSDLMRQELGPDDSVVFVDDFAGTGDQVCSSWPEEVTELLPGGPKTYLVLVGASARARQAISSVTGLTVIASFELDDSDGVFNEACTHFDDGEKAALLEYCRKADRHSPKGYGDCGFVVVFAHRCPNDSIPILHADHHKWRGLFRRYH